ncbi:MAG TPA: lipopolysaccharide transport periplasmic protein LptA [Burkholderiales bacterium]|nr:lipopolysaccharide transport periplasmic protein LptA [Burkholderiales bacterium]
MPAIASLFLACLASPAVAERADRDKPTQLEANRMSADDARRVSIFEGNVVLTKGTITLRGDRIVVRVDAEGYQHATVTGNPVRFKQRGDATAGRPAIWTEAEAQRLEIDEKNERIELFERARVIRDQDEVRGEYMLLDQRSDFLSVSAGKGTQPPAADARVRAVIQPKAPSSSGTEKPPAR